MICNFTVTNTETQEKHVFKNIYLAEDNKDAFLVFPSTNEEVYINRESTSNKLKFEENRHTKNSKLVVYEN